MKKIVLYTFFIFFLLSNFKTVRNPDYININNDSLFQISDLLKLRWVIFYDTKLEYPYLQEGFLFPTYSPDYAIDAQSGKKLYYKPTKNVRLFRNNCSDSIFAFRNYERIFVINTYKGKYVFKTFRKCKYPIRPKPQAIKDSLFCFAINDSTLTAYNLRTDSVLWNFSAKPYLYEFVIKFDDKIWINFDQYLYALSRKDGTVIWKIKTGFFFSDPIVKKNKLYVMIKDKGVLCFNLKTQKNEWLFTEIDNLPFQSIKLLADNHNIYFMCSGLYSINQETGELNWKNSRISTSYSASMVLCKDYIITLVEDGELLINDAVACNKNNGKLVFNMSEEATNRTEKAFKNNIFFYADTIYKNQLYAFGQDSIYCFEILR